MVRVRGIAFVGAMQFVKDEFGPEAHQQVLDALPEANRATFAMLCISRACDGGR